MASRWTVVNQHFAITTESQKECETPIVNSTLIVATAGRVADRLAAGCVVDVDEISEQQARVQPSAESTQLDLEVSRRRNQSKFAGWASSVRPEFVAEALRSFVAGIQNGTQETRDLTAMLRSRSNRAPTNCALCGRPLAEHPKRPYVRCTNKAKKCAGAAVANFHCARFNEMACGGVNMSEAIQLPLVWSCTVCDEKP